MLKWMREHWKLLTVVGLGIAAGLTMGLLIAFAAPVAAFILPLAASLPWVGPAIAAMALPAAAATVGALTTAATWVAGAVLNTVATVAGALFKFCFGSKKTKSSNQSFEVLDEEDSDLESFTSSHGRMNKKGFGASSTELLVDEEEFTKTDSKKFPSLQLVQPKTDPTETTIVDLEEEQDLTGVKTVGLGGSSD